MFSILYVLKLTCIRSTRLTITFLLIIIIGGLAGRTSVTLATRKWFVVGFCLRPLFFEIAKVYLYVCIMRSLKETYFYLFTFFFAFYLINVMFSVLYVIQRIGTYLHLCYLIEYYVCADRYYWWTGGKSFYCVDY